MYHFVYKTIRRLTGEYYIGVHSTNNLHDKYMGSGKRIKYIIAKHGKASLQRTILQIYDTRQNALVAEQQFVTHTVLLDPFCLNLIVGGGGNNIAGGHGITKEARQRLSELHMGRPKSVETKQRISDSKRGIPSPLKGRPLPDDVRQKMTTANRERNKSPKSDACKAKIKATALAQHRKFHRPVITCPHCSKTGGNSGMTRYHFDNCKMKI